MSAVEQAFAAPAPRVAGLREDTGIAGIVFDELAVARVAAQAPLKASRFTIDPGSGTPEDHHAVHELWFIGQGVLEVHYDGAWHVVRRGDALYFSPWHKHHSRNTGAEQVLVFSVWWP